MKDKILFLLDMEWIHFGIAKSLQHNYDCDLYAIVDIDNAGKFFYQNQQLIKFKKTWYYRDHLLKDNKSPDITYLRYFEEKYKINLWATAFAERFFFQYNKYHTFTSEEILNILEKECKFFEGVLNEIKPDYLIVKFTDSHQSQLLLEMCKAMDIKVLMLTSTRFGFRYGIFSDYDRIDEFSKMIDTSNDKQRSPEELKNYLKKFHALREITSLESTLHIPLRLKIKKYMQYLMSINSDDFKNYYANFGKTKLKVIINFFFLKRPYRTYFINKNFIREIKKNTSFIYFPLHYEPERQLLLVAPYYRNQLTLITQIAQSLPVGYELYVKEHVSMYLNVWRDISYYKKILAIPNVRLIHPSVNSENLMKECSLVVTIAGTTGLEAAFYDKPVIVFADVSYSNLPSVYRIKNIEDLPQAIRTMLGKKVDFSTLNEYVNLIEKNSFEIDLTSLYLDFDKYFSNEFNSARSNISPSKMNSFLEQHTLQFEQLALEYIKKIKYYKEEDFTNKKSIEL